MACSIQPSRCTGSQKRRVEIQANVRQSTELRQICCFVPNLNEFILEIGLLLIQEKKIRLKGIFLFILTNTFSY